MASWDTITDPDEPVAAPQPREQKLNGVRQPGIKAELPFDLWPHQQEALDALRVSVRQGLTRPVLQAPTGAGKLRLGAAVIWHALQKGNRICLTVPYVSLIDQSVRALWDLGIKDVGVLQANHPMTDWSKPVQVCSIQTLQARDSRPRANVIVVDECHLVFEWLCQWMAKPEWKDIPFIGLSATPWTKGLGKHYNNYIVAATTQELIDKGYLSGFEVFAPAHPDLTGVKTVAGDYQKKGLGKAMNKPKLVADIVDTWLEKGQGLPTLCFAVDRAHAKHIQQKFEAADVSCGYQDAFTKPEERDEIRKKFHSGEFQVVANVDTLSVGVDWDVRCIVLARPTRSAMRYVQIVGRGLRTAPGKDRLRLLDHSDTTARLGFVTDIHYDQLDDGKGRQKAEPKDAAVLPKECPKCAYLRPPKVSVCPSCGFKPEPRSNVEVEDGKLVAITKRAGKRVVSRDEKQRWYSGLLWIAQTKGYSRGWAGNKFRGKFDVWPRGLDEVPEAPLFDILNYVKSRQIAWAKAKAKLEGRR